MFSQVTGNLYVYKDVADMIGCSLTSPNTLPHFPAFIANSFRAMQLFLAVGSGQG